MAGVYRIRYQKGSGNGPRLAMVIGSQFLQFAVADSNGRIIHVGELTWDKPATSDGHESMVRQILYDQRLAGQSYSKCWIAILNTSYALVPNAFYQHLEAPALVNFTSGKQQGATLTRSTGDITVCYQADAGLMALLEKSFPSATVFHSSYVNIRLLTSFETMHQQDVLVNLHHGQMEMTVALKGEVRFYNAFETSSDEDILYYLLFTMEQLELQPATTRIMVAGEVEQGSPLMEAIRKYANQVTMSPRHPSIQLATGEPVPVHQFLTLLHLHLCE